MITFGVCLVEKKVIYIYIHIYICKNDEKENGGQSVGHIADGARVAV